MYYIKFSFVEVEKINKIIYKNIKCSFKHTLFFSLSQRYTIFIF